MSNVSKAIENASESYHRHGAKKLVIFKKLFIEWWLRELFHKNMQESEEKKHNICFEKNK
jgi:hypothetical protein